MTVVMRKSTSIPMSSPPVRRSLSIKRECLDRMIFFSGESLRRAINEFLMHYHRERNHQSRATN